MSGTTNPNRADLLQLIIDNVTSKTKSDRVTTEGLSEVLNCIVNELGCEIDTFLDSIQTNTDDIAALEVSLTDALAQEITDRIAGDANFLSQLQVLEVNLNSAIASVASDLAQEIIDRAAGDAALQANIDVNSTAISGNNTDIAALQAEDVNLQTQITSNDDELTLQQAQIVSNDADIAALQSDSASLQTQVSDNDTDIAALQSDVASNTSSIVTNSANIGQNTVDIAALQSADISLQNQITSNDSDIAALQANVISNDADISALQAEDVNLQGQITSNDAEIATLQGQVSGALTDITTLQGDVASNDADILVLQGQVNTNITDIATLQADNINLQTQINTNDAELNSQQTQITDNDADIAALQAQVNTLGTGFVADVELVGNDLRLLDTFNNVVGTPVDLSVFLDNTNLARIVTASLDQNTGLVDFIRDDASNFCLDLSSLQAGVGVQSIVAGTNVTVDNTDPLNPIISAAGGIQSITAGTNITIDDTDPQNLIISASGGGGVSDGVFGDITISGGGTNYQINDDSITGDAIVDSTINGSLKLQGASVVAANIAPNAITQDKVSDNAIGVDELDDSVTGAPTAGQILSYDGTDLDWIDAPSGSGQTTGTFNVTGISGSTGSFATVSGGGTWYRTGDVVHIKMNFLGLTPDPTSTGSVVITTDLPFAPSTIPQDLNVGELQGSGDNFSMIIARITSSGSIVFRTNNGGNDINIPYPMPTANSFAGNIHGSIFINV